MRGDGRPLDTCRMLQGHGSRCYISVQIFSTALFVTMKTLLLLFVLVTVLVGFAAAAKSRPIPSFIPVCKRTARDFDACVLKATESLRPKLARGIPELRVPALEPLVVPQVRLEQQGTRAVNFNCTLTDVHVFGLSEFQIISENADVVDKMQISGRVRLPTLRLESDYEIDGRILLNFDLNQKLCTPFLKQIRNSADSEGDVTLNGGIVTRRGTTTNRFLNENSRDILQEITPVIETVTARIVDDIANKVFSSFPYDQLFPV
ncbi:hypothetical protein B566_EDAN017382 [Ephemera danica]|nr:hypothetical protein B566_EDAN017382 [Ephemera danica]